MLVVLVVVVRVEGKMGRELLWVESGGVLGVGMEGKMVFWGMVLLGLRLRLGTEEEVDLVADEPGLVGEV